VIFRTPDWADFVQLAVSEIRLYGAANFQVSRRLRAMILNLQEGLPENRRPALRRELDLLDRTLQKCHGFTRMWSLRARRIFRDSGDPLLARCRPKKIVTPGRTKCGKLSLGKTPSQLQHTNFLLRCTELPRVGSSCRISITHEREGRWLRRQRLYVDHRDNVYG
jgi:hypothetical protein